MNTEVYGKDKDAVMPLNNRKGQQLVEFALVLPIIMMVLMIIIEIGFALNARMSLAEAAKMSLSQANQFYSITATDDNEKAEKVREAIEKSVVNYFAAHNLPYEDQISVNIERISGSETALVRVNYSYYPVFQLRNVFGQDIIPTAYNFSSYQLINDALLKKSTFDSGFTAKDLSSFGKTATELDVRTSVLKKYEIEYDDSHKIDFRNHIAFLIEFETFETTENPDHIYARLFNWWGEDLLPPNLVLNISTGHLEVKSQYYSTSWFDTGIPYNWVLESLGFTHGIFSSINYKSGLPTFYNYKLDLTSTNSSLNAGIPWCNQTTTTGNCDNDMTGSNIDNLNKRGLSLLLMSSGSAYGSFEPVKLESGTANFEEIHSYLYKNSSDYILKLFLPVSSNPIAPTEVFQYSFSIGTDGKYPGAATSVDIVDCYLDNDGDNIPNAWDLHPTYPDANGDVGGNAVRDGLETVLMTDTSLITQAPEIFSESNLTNIVVDNTSVACKQGGIVQNKNKIVFRVKNTPPYAINPFEADPVKKVAAPFIYSTGMLNNKSINSYIPAEFQVDIVKVLFQKLVQTASVSTDPCVSTWVNAGSFLYYKYNDGGIKYRRKVATWDTTNPTAQKEKFIYDTTVDGAISLGRSRELDFLLYNTGPFAAANKIDQEINDE